MLLTVTLTKREACGLWQIIDATHFDSIWARNMCDRLDTSEGFEWIDEEIPDKEIKNAVKRIIDAAGGDGTQTCIDDIGRNEVTLKLSHSDVSRFQEEHERWGF